MNNSQKFADIISFLVFRKVPCRNISPGLHIHATVLHFPGLPAQAASTAILLRFGCSDDGKFVISCGF